MSSRSTFRNMMVVRTSDIEKKACVLHFPNYQRLLVFFILSFFEKKFLIWSMRKPRVINIILSSSVKFTVNQALWMWVYALAPVLGSALLSVAFLFRVRATVTLYQTQVSAFWLRCHNFHHEYCYLQGLKCLAEFHATSFFFLYILIVKPPT